jgi:hypothetical protein
MAQLTFWSKRLNWQLRVSALTTIELEVEQVNVAWERIKQSPARADYLSANGHRRAMLSPDGLLNRLVP